MSHECCEDFTPAQLLRPAIGSEHPDQSHFTSRHYYEIGDLDIGRHAGWLGRYLDLAGDEENPSRAPRWTARSRR